MRSAIFIVLCVASLEAVIAQSVPEADEHRTVVDPRAGEEILHSCVYRIAVSTLKRPLRATWVIFERGQDSVKWFQDKEIRKFSADHHLALVLAIHCRSKEHEDMIVEPSRGVGRALFTALDQLADSEGVPELRTVPVIVLGWSGAGSLVGRLAGYRPERYLAGIAYVPGQYEPLGVDTIKLPPEAMRQPQLIIANGGDNINGTERPYNYFRKYFDQGAPWTFAVQNHTPHCCLQNAQGLILDWLQGILTSDSDSRDVGMFGYITAKVSSTRDEWYQPVFNVISARSGKGRAATRRNELPAGWMPSPEFASRWVAFERRQKPPAVWFETPAPAVAAKP